MALFSSLNGLNLYARWLLLGCEVRRMHLPRTPVNKVRERTGLQATRPSSLVCPGSLRTAPGVVSRLGDLHAVRFEGDAARVRSAAHSGVERVDRRYLLAGELEVDCR